MIRVLFIDHTPFAGGAQLVLADHIANLNRDRFFPIVGCTDRVPDLIERFEKAGAEVIPLNLPRLRTPSALLPLRVMRAAMEMRAVVKRMSIDLVVANTSRAAYIASLALVGSRTPLVWWARDFEFGQGWFRLLRHRAARIICVSDAIRTFYGGGGHQKYSKVVVGSSIHSRLEMISEGEVHEARKKWGLEPENVVIGYLGRLVEGKGPEDLVQAFAQVRATRPRLRLLIAGTGANQEGDVEARLRRKVEEAGLAESVIFTGYQSNETLLYRMIDIFVLPSRYAEAMPTSAVQAMMAGKPVIATTTGGTPELVRDGETGILVPPRSPNELSTAIERVLEDDELRLRVAEMGRSHALGHHREDMTTREAEAIYESVWDTASRIPRHRSMAGKSPPEPATSANSQVIHGRQKVKSNEAR